MTRLREEVGVDEAANLGTEAKEVRLCKSARVNNDYDCVVEEG